ncbi:hypothetical protein RJ639_007187 [Escallonia herrerae]|uniref:Josephin-like protein n=1 Tax=Escallonia herrerae TaxID=1293975 RepID=A0AA89AW07_9ASTE|nr:hypothetical protein RJ639_007187 [Escallonia herrerae]
MSVRANGRVSTDEKTTAVLHKQHSGKRVNCSRARHAGTCRFGLPKPSELSPARYLKHVGDKVVAVLRLASRRRASPKDVPSSVRATPFVAPIDSSRAEAIDDCIEFINASSSLQRSKSVSC